MKVVRNQIMFAIQVLQKYGDVPMSRRMREVWLNNIKLLIDEQGVVHDFIEKEQGKAIPPKSFLEDFYPLREKYAAKDGGVAGQINDKRMLLESIGSDDILRSANIKKEIDDLEKNVFVPFKDRFGNVVLWDFEWDDSDKESEKYKEIDAFRKKHEVYYIIASSEKKLPLDELWSDEIKEYHSLVSSISDVIGSYLLESVDLDFIKVHDNVLPDVYPPNMNNIVNHNVVKDIFWFYNPKDAKEAHEMNPNGKDLRKMKVIKK